VQISLPDGGAIDRCQDGGEEPDNCRRSTIIYLDDRSLTRECFAVKLSALLPEVTVRPVGDPEGIPEAAIGNIVCIVVHTHAMDLASDETSATLLRVHQRHPGIGMVVISDLEVLSNVLQAMRLGAKAYIPTSVSPEIASEIIRLVRVGGSFVPTSALFHQFDAPTQANSLQNHRAAAMRSFRRRRSRMMLRMSVELSAPGGRPR
jgi:DNA-binding NarL/FixJ family response regulator